MTIQNPYKYFKTSPEIIQLAVMYYVRYPLSLRQVEDILHERGIDVCHETVRFWWNRFGPKLAKDIRKKRKMQGESAEIIPLVSPGKSVSGRLETFPF